MSALMNQYNPTMFTLKQSEADIYWGSAPTLRDQILHESTRNEVLLRDKMYTRSSQG